ncbi:thioredoxin domain-containing protein [Stieleria varia]|uniref:Spermatogenesis-associated protein 20-like TRX domain-containing protein n=1 Tax=Stieleria varia TaxID=2528005 RepID=A0A5C6A2W3_9BACT|nr:thioredoxin domain-containing protein [Stieleria varia]TWT93736.1 hypothetical protein Pla52n_55640 [Stieleria varia]
MNSSRLCLSLLLCLISLGWCSPLERIFAEEPTQPARPTNRLAAESSPYLLQHAHNPVDWYPWGDEAFAKAKRENKMVFLSVGYAACHWCHVMERETFEDAEIAAFLNEHFVCIKVDREERPDVDQIYMTAVQMISGSGGWPMSVFLLPDAKPFWGGTYFPARTGDRGQATGFLSIIRQINEAWKSQPDTVSKQAEHVTSAIQAQQALESKEERSKRPALQPSWVDAVARELARQFDEDHGGFGYSETNPNQPKFPEPSNLIYLLHRAKQQGLDEVERERARTMLTATLDGMIAGAMFDHIGGGFHRYSVDRYWMIPHFEKMLYDNAQLASVFAQAYQLTENPEYRLIAERTCQFVIDELTAPGGGFYSSLDADSEGVEGKFYRWTKEELDEAANEIDGYATFAKTYRLDQPPTFEEEFFVPHPGKPLAEIAGETGKTFPELVASLEASRKRLLEVRAKRKRPPTDTKILTAWNGLMIAGLADAGRLLDRPDFIDAAIASADFIQSNLVDENGRLLRTHAGGAAKLNGYIDDYAFYVSGLLALYQATENPKWLAAAEQWNDKLLELFWDEADHGFFFTTHDHPTLIVRVKDSVDSAVPSGVGVTLQNLADLVRLTEDKGKPKLYVERILQTLSSLTPYFQRAPASVPRAATVLAQSTSAFPG